MSEQSTRDANLAASVVGLFRNGRASSRRDVMDQLQLAPATASLAIKRLLDDGILIEGGQGPSTGGRRPRILRLADQVGVIACAELGARHARCGLVDANGRLSKVSEITVNIGAGADAVFQALSAEWQQLLASDSKELRGVAVAFPGPVDLEHGLLVSPARMPGWSGAKPLAALTERLNVPGVIENDARAGALGEARQRHGKLDTFIYVKAGMGIGGAWIVDGEVFRGPHGLAGELTHNQLPGIHKEHGCGCGNRGCLELVASGAALCQQLTDRGISVTGTRGLVELVRDAHPEASTLVRAAGAHLGEVLAPLVNFLNPSGVIIGGGLGMSDAFVASLRGVLYDRCVPMCTQGLVIEASVAGANAALIGLGELASRVSAERKKP